MDGTILRYVHTSDELATEKVQKEKKKIHSHEGIPSKSTIAQDNTTRYVRTEQATTPLEQKKSSIVEV